MLTDNTAKTRKEEIVRFEQSKVDGEFSSMLKMRSLNPEHVETQTILRRDIRVSMECFVNIWRADIALTGNPRARRETGGSSAGFEEEAYAE